MEYCTVVPHVISERFQLHLADVRDNPVDPFCEQTQPLFRHVESGLGHIKDPVPQWQIWVWCGVSRAALGDFAALGQCRNAVGGAER